MKKSRLLGAMCACILTTFYFNSHAAIVSYGNLTSDDATNYITDTVTGRQYTRPDAFSLSYADTVAATQPGGAWVGWSIANSTVADDFINALIGSISPCEGAVLYGTDCGTLIGWVDGDFGASYNSSLDDYFYISTYDTPSRDEYDVGIFEISSDGVVQDYDDWGSFTLADDYTTLSGSINSVSFLLYRDVTTLPVPPAVWLFGSGLLGLVGMARRKKAA